MFGLGKEELLSRDVEFLILIKATEDTFNQTVHSRFSYRYDEMLWGHKFTIMSASTSEGSRGTLVDLDQLDETTEAELN